MHPGLAAELECAGPLVCAELASPSRSGPSAIPCQIIPALDVAEGACARAPLRILFFHANPIGSGEVEVPEWALVELGIDAGGAILVRAQGEVSRSARHVELLPRELPRADASGSLAGTLAPRLRELALRPGLIVACRYLGELRVYLVARVDDARDEVSVWTLVGPDTRVTVAPASGIARGQLHVKRAAAEAIARVPGMEGVLRQLIDLVSTRELIPHVVRGRGCHDPSRAIRWRYFRNAATMECVSRRAAFGYTDRPASGRVFSRPRFIALFSTVRSNRTAHPVLACMLSMRRSSCSTSRGALRASRQSTSVCASA